MTDPADRPARTVPVLIGGDEMGRIDEAAQRLGLSPDALMESAGAAVAEIALVEMASIAGLAPGALTVVLCGAGNNGGDGFVAARRLAAAGRPVVAVLVGDPSRIGGVGGSAAAHNWTVLTGDGLGRVVEPLRGAHAGDAASTSAAPLPGERAHRRPARLWRERAPA